MPTTLSEEEAPAHQDYEASSHCSDQESDFEEDKAIDADYTSSKLQERDRALLEEEEERENLLTEKGSSKGSKRIGRKGLRNGSDVVTGHGERRGKNRRRGQTKRNKLSRQKDEVGESMYEMEEGGGREDTSSLSSSSSAELDRSKYDYSSTSKVSRQPSSP